MITVSYTHLKTREQLVADGVITLESELSKARFDRKRQLEAVDLYLSLIHILDIKDISGNIRFSTTINEGSKRHFLLMQEDYITLLFSLSNPVYFKLGDYVDNELGIFELVDLYKMCIRDRSNAEEGSITALRKQLILLIKDYDDLGRVRRGGDAGKALLTQISNVQKELNAAEQASGRFQSCLLYTSTNVWILWMVIFVLMVRHP